MSNVIDQTEGENFVAYHGDCIDVVRGDRAYPLFVAHTRI